MVCIFMTILVLSISVFKILLSKIVKKINKNYPCIYYVKVMNPKNWIGNVFGPSWISTFRKNALIPQRLAPNRSRNKGDSYWVDRIVKNQNFKSRCITLLHHFKIYLQTILKSWNFYLCQLYRRQKFQFLSKIEKIAKFLTLMPLKIEKWKIPAYHFSITLKSTNMTKFALIWLEVF